MIVKVDQTDGHVRVLELETIHNGARAALAAAEHMRDGESADVCITTYDRARDAFVNRVERVEVEAGEVYTVVDGVRRYHGSKRGY